MQRILGRTTKTTATNNTTTTPSNRKFYFPKKDKDPNAMDIDRLTTEERNALMKEGKCFKCRQFGHLSRDCKKGVQTQNETKKMDGKGTATHIRALVAKLDEEEKKKFEESLETEGLGFKKEN